MTASPPSSSEPHVRPLRILVADGEALARRTAQRVLGLASHEVTTASDSDETLDLLRDHGFDLALIALDLPGGGGIETAKLYRFLALGRPRMPIVALATRWTLDACARGHEAGIEHFLAKPLIPDDLLAAVAAAVPAPPAPAELDDPFGVVTSLFQRAQPRAPAVDPLLLDRLEQVGGKAFVGEVIDDFLRETAAAVSRFADAAGTGSLASARACGRRLEELAASVGADRLRRMGRALAALGATEFANRAGDYAGQIEAEHGQVVAALSERRRARHAQGGR